MPLLRGTIYYKPTIILKGNKVGMVLTKFQLHVIEVAIEAYKGTGVHRSYRPLREATITKSGITMGVLGQTGSLHKTIKKALETDEKT